jgi:hypothetical protein
MENIAEILIVLFCIGYLIYSARKNLKENKYDTIN